ncbi:sulfurtransferase-like selenium metabolism protein YedF [Shewanella sp. NIFS-20-20]|uniref:sulfurtransferase-like selenium metabolism protein YedF n=1 Tax=Shewanella sp. NIFS-20-20 TaxID=2853806 RepID=UPI001C46310E|nr:sulfurtransferase-like selenium metabolism protein YedF [Shewanella sp. NIFS-20-20]MBV7317396.1 sulfurtransferase-like selenium metabolism protein YedF [Shewanella sp. NIFS-20-20]
MQQSALPEVDFQLEIMGEPCPYPAVATLEAMSQLAVGQVLEVVTDCLQSINNIPLDAKNHGYQVLALTQQGPLVRFLLRK